MRPTTWLTALACGLLAGCGGGPRMAPLTGRVAYPDGRPVHAGKVILMPEDPTLPSPVAEIEPGGRYAVYTEWPGDGARLGRYTAVVLPPGDDYGPRHPRPIDGKFADPATSGFAVTVREGANTLDLTVTGPGPK